MNFVTTAFLLLIGCTLCCSNAQVINGDDMRQDNRFCLSKLSHGARWPLCLHNPLLQAACYRGLSLWQYIR